MIILLLYVALSLDQPVMKNISLKSELKKINWPDIWDFEDVISPYDSFFNKYNEIYN